MSWRDRAAAAVKPGSVGFVGSPTPSLSPDWGYTLADLQEMDRLLSEIADCEEWDAPELERLLDERGRMAPANVPEALKMLRARSRAAVGRWPDKAPKGERIALCVLVAA